MLITLLKLWNHFCTKPHILNQTKRNVVATMSGNYRISMRTPMGPQNGMLSFTDEGGTISGSIHTMGNTSYFKNGKSKGSSFEFSGILNTGLFRLKYTAKGVVNGNKLEATATTDYGVFRIFGTQVSTPIR